MLAALVNTMKDLAIAPGTVARFLRSMAMDLTVTSYETWEDLCGYMDGSAAVIGEMMLPVLEPKSVAAAFEPARQLGIAFQVTNFLRDVGEDLDRGRVYLPLEDLRRFGADIRGRRVTPEWGAFMSFEIARTREMYRQADAGIGHLPARAARCITTARVLYGRILDEIEANGHDVFTRRAQVPMPVKLAVTARNLLPMPTRSPRPGSGASGRKPAEAMPFTESP